MVIEADKASLLNKHEPNSLDAILQSIDKDNLIDYSETVNQKCSCKAGMRKFKAETQQQVSNLQARCLLEDQTLVDVLVKYGNNPDGIPALHYAIKMNDEKAVDTLLRHGASPFTRDCHEINCLYRAVESGNLKLVNKFVDLGVDVHDINSSYSPFLLAISQNKNEIARYLFLYGAKITHHVGYFNEAFSKCCAYGNCEMLAFLVENGKKIDTDSYGYLLYSIYHTSAKDKSAVLGKKRIQCLQYLLDKKMYTLPVNPNDYFQIIANTYPEFLQFLLDNKSLSSNQFFGDKENPTHHILQLATFNINFKIELVELLIKRGADVRAKASANYNQTVLHYVAHSCARTLKENELMEMKALFSILIRSGADINAKDSYGERTPLSFVKDANLRGWLIAQGANN